jgi:hypothetical protein
VPFGLVETSQHFTVAYCPHHLGDDMMEAASTSEMSVYSRQHGTIFQKSHLLSRQYENLKSQSISQSIQNALIEMYWTILLVNYIIGIKAQYS